MGKKKPENIRALTGFEPVTSANNGAMLYQLNTKNIFWSKRNEAKELDELLKHLEIIKLVLK